MSVRTVSALVIVLAISILAADMNLGCTPNGGYVYGVVEAKYSGSGDNDMSILQIASDTFTVPAAFYSEVQVGDLVRYDGKNWTIVKSAGSTYGNQTPENPAPGQVNVPPLPPAPTH